MDGTTTTAAPSPAPATSGNGHPPPLNLAPPKPYLGGTIKSEAGLLIFEGEWAMSKADTITSRFRYEVKPGSEAAETIGSLPCEANLRGFFMLKQPTGESKIEEQDVTLSVAKEARDDVLHEVYGSGSNPFGAFSLEGTYNRLSGKLELFKAYTGKPLPARKPLSARGKAPRSKTPRAASTKTFKAVAEKAPRTSHVRATTPSIEQPSLVRSKSGRKRVLPSHLRETDTPLVKQYTGPLAHARDMLQKLQVNNDNVLCYVFLV